MLDGDKSLFTQAFFVQKCVGKNGKLDSMFGLFEIIRIFAQN